MAVKELLAVPGSEGRVYMGGVGVPLTVGDVCSTRRCVEGRGVVRGFLEKGLVLNGDGIRIRSSLCREWFFWSSN